MVKSKTKLTNEIVKFKSSDKEHHQKPDNEDLANCCTPVFSNFRKCKLWKDIIVKKFTCSQITIL